jgi:glutamine amidotransferase
MSNLVKVGVIDAGMGTWPSTINMVSAIGFEAERVNEPEDAMKFTHLVMPGVGSFQAGSQKLASTGWLDAARDFASSGKSLLGICLGMQLLGASSEEGQGRGLDVLSFSSERLQVGGSRKIPNIGWATVQSTTDHPLLRNLGDDARFYFVHSFAVPVETKETIGITQHNEPFTSVVAKGNVMGVQFHPEKSSRFGMRLFENFLRESW